MSFWCYSTPELEFDNLEEGQIISNTYYEFTASFRQSEGELLKEYIAILYDGAKNKIKQSSTIFGGTELAVGFAGLEDDASYYIEGRGVTVNNTEMTTGLIKFSVDCVLPSVYSLIHATNNGGAIHISTYVISVGFNTISGGEPIYLEPNGIDLSSDGLYINEGFDISRDFVLSVTLKGEKLYERAIWMNEAQDGKGREISLTPMRGDLGDGNGTVFYYKFEMSDEDGYSYYLYSSALHTTAAAEEHTLRLTRQSGYFNLTLAAAGEED